ncbi:MAG: alpha/beta fold hydrolase [Rhodospirillaceae bacterium]|nr:alpha/beta fold hydrolase [Rhodospirillaceae bacterium]
MSRLALFLNFLLAACAPYLQPAGPPIQAPVLNGDRIVAADGAELPLKSWQPEGEAQVVILALHGFNDYLNGFAAPGEFWAGYGIATYAYDQRGFGRAANPGVWPGTEALTADLETAAALIAARHPGRPLYLVGDSMGGAVILAAVAEGRTLPAAGIVLVAPAVWGRTTMPFYQRAALWLAANTVPWLKVRGTNLGILPSDNIPMLRKRGADPLVIKDTRIDSVHGLVDLMDTALAAGPALRLPTLLQYGANDQVIPPIPMRKMIADLPPESAAFWRIATYRDGYHMLLHDLKAEIPLADIVAWTKGAAANRTPLPSGADAAARD